MYTVETAAVPRRRFKELNSVELCAHSYAYTKAWRDAHKDKVSEYGRQYYQRHKEALKVRVKALRSAQLAANDLRDGILHGAEGAGGNRCVELS